MGVTGSKEKDALQGQSGITSSEEKEDGESGSTYSKDIVGCVLKREIPNGGRGEELGLTAPKAKWRLQGP